MRKNWGSKKVESSKTFYFVRNYTRLKLYLLIGGKRDPSFTFYFRKKTNRGIKRYLNFEGK